VLVPATLAGEVDDVGLLRLRIQDQRPDPRDLGLSTWPLIFEVSKEFVVDPAVPLKHLHPRVTATRESASADPMPYATHR
jgi:hypothetical protein